MMKNKEIKSTGLMLAAFIAPAVIFLGNPNVRLFDILPDFIACFIIAMLLRYPSDRAPYFSEAREAFIKLGIVSLLKIPAFFIMSAVRAGNVSDNDIILLLTFSFAIFEGVLFVSAVNNLFSALFYLGERSSASSLISPFRISKKSDKTMTPEALKTLTIAMWFIRLVTTVLPETLLLTRSVDTGAYGGPNPYAFYPYAIILAILVSSVIWIVFARRFCAYIRAIKNEGMFTAAVDSLISDEARGALLMKIEKREISSALALLPIGAIFVFVLRLDNFREINLLPYFALGVIYTVMLYRLKAHTSADMTYAFLFGGAFTVSALAAQIVESIFLNSYSYEELVGSLNVKAKYIPVIILEGAASILFITFIIMTSLVFRRLWLDTCGAGSSSERRISEEAVSVLKRVVAFSASGILIAVSRFLSVLFRYFSINTTVSVNDAFGNSYLSTVTESYAPWFSIVLFASAILFMISSFALRSKINDAQEQRLVQ